MESIKKYGFVTPILCTKSGYVLDGQNRLEAAKRLNHSVFYTEVSMHDDEALGMVIEINACMSNWKVEDYFNAYCSEKVEQYLWLKSMLKEYGLPFAVAYRLLPSYRLFKTGQMKLSKVERAQFETVLQEMRDVADFSEAYAPFKRNPTFLSALSDVCRRTNYDHGRMMIQLRKHGGHLMKSSARIDYIDRMENIYNKGKGTHNRVSFRKKK
jgi:hypothetical protein